MKEFEGTPGSWIVDKDFDVTTNGGCVVAWTAVGVFSQEERISNAHLISAAPELLSALQEVIKSLEITLRVGHERIIELGGECVSPEVMIKGHSEIARAKSAIAKALGEPQ